MNARITDMTYLNSISDGDEDFKLDMINTFLETAPGYLAGMRSGLDAMNWKKIGDIAHSMKPSFTMLGIHGKKDLILEIENLGRSETDTGRLPELIMELETVIAQASQELREVIDEIRQ